jgi:hypothetical protein
MILDHGSSRKLIHIPNTVSVFTAREDNLWHSLVDGSKETTTKEKSGCTEITIVLLMLDSFSP